MPLVHCTCALLFHVLGVAADTRSVGFFLVPIFFVLVCLFPVGFCWCTLGSLRGQARYSAGWCGDFLLLLSTDVVGWDVVVSSPGFPLFSSPPWSGEGA